MKCPNCKVNLEETILSNVQANYCPVCLGIFFEKDELRIAKDEKDKNLSWLDIDLWKDKSKFEVSKEKLLCPACKLPLYTVTYGTSDIKVEVCSVCEGVWLDRGEFKKIIEYLQKEAQYKILQDYFSNLAQELKEVFSGPEPLKDEISDVLVMLKLLNYKFVVQFPALTEIISKLPK